MAVTAAIPQSPIDRPRRVGETLAGDIDNLNAAFTTAVAFFHDPPFETAAVYLNGARLRGAGIDYTVSESGGLGTGFDTITTIEPPRATLKATDSLTVDYIEQ